MNAEILGNPDFGHLKMTFDPGDKVLVESGAMAAMSTGMDVNSQMMGGFLSALGRKVFAGESLMVGEYSAQKSGELMISPAIPGQVLHRKMNGDKLLLQAGAFLACTPGVKISTVFGGFRAMFSGEGMFFLQVEGQGDLWFNAYGSILEKEVQGELVVDTGHVVGWEPGLDWTISGMGNLFSTFFSGEGLVIRFKGRGKVWVQTRSMGGLASWLTGYCWR